MFLERGFAQTTIEGVAAAAGMTKRTIYTRHPDKAALFLAAVQHAIERLIVPESAMHELETDDLATTLTAVARTRVARITTPEGLKLQRIIATESYRFPEIFTASYDQGTKPVINYLSELLQRHIPDIECPTMAAIVFMSMVVSGPVRIIVSGNVLTQSEIDDRINYGVQLFLNGVGKEKRPRDRKRK